MPTARNVTRKAFQCGLYEAQDVFQDVDGIDLIHLEPAWGLRFKEKLQRRLLYRDVSRKLVDVNPGLQKVRVTRDYDLFVAVCQTYWDFLYLSAIEGWKDHCKTSVCWIDEMWASEIPLFKYWLHALNRFDYVFTGLKSSVEPLSRALGRPCHWLAPGVDTLRFSPYPDPPERVIDVYSMGRRREGVHRALLESARNDRLFYVHDTISGVNLEVCDHREHRDLIARTAQRSKYFTVWRGRYDEETGGQVSIGFRYFEGTAAGAVLIGEEPPVSEFREMFYWPDVVIPIESDGSDVIEVIRRLDREPERMDAASRANVVGALRHHDWAYRWKEMLRVVGYEASPKLTKREQRLQELAERVSHADSGGGTVRRLSR